MALSIFDDKSGRLKSVKNRVSNASYWGIYRRACCQRPEIVNMMEEAIREAVRSNRYLEEGGSIPNSTWLGSEILSYWEHSSEWNSFCGDDENVSSALFGQIMWTVMYDDERHWCTTKTTRANMDREERVYWLL
jgi:hypothetical protein